MLGTLFALAAILLATFALGFYVFLTLGLTALSLGWLFSDRPIWQILGHIPWNLATNTTLLALPLYVLMGEILLRSGITEGMYQALAKWLNRLPGSLLHTNIVGCANEDIHIGMPVEVSFERVNDDVSLVYFSPRK